MTYSLRNRHTLEEKLGRPVLAKLFELVRKGSIQKSHVKDLSYDYNLNLYTTYTRGVDRDDLLETIVQDMLDQWCDQTLGSLPPAEASQLLLHHLEETCSSFVVHSIREAQRQVAVDPLPSKRHAPNRRQNPPERAESGRREEAETEPGSSQQQPPPTPSVILLSSTGLSPESVGDKLGVFDHLQQHHNSPAYRQRHTVAGREPHYLNREHNGNWRVGPGLRGNCRGLLNRTERSDNVPTNNWLYAEGGCCGKRGWYSDPQITVTTNLPSVCGLITISLHGAAANAQPGTGGEYRATGDWSSGHPVFSNGVTYLCVVPGGRQLWRVRDSPDSGVFRLEIGCVTWCPASPRAALSHRWNRSLGRYWNNPGWLNGDIRITCDTHQE